MKIFLKPHSLALWQMGKAPLIPLISHRVGEPSRARPLTPPSVRVRTWRFQ